MTGLSNFDPNKVTQTLTGFSTTNSAPTAYSVDLVTGATALGATTTTSINNNGNINTDTLGARQATLGTAIMGDASVSKTLSVSGATTTNGITNTGNIATGTLSSTGLATLNSAAITTNATVGGTLAVTGATTTNGITNTGNTATGTLSSTGLATLNSAAITTNATVGGTLAVTGATTLNGATTVNNSLNVNGAATVVGTTRINTTGTAATSIGNSVAPVTVEGSAVYMTGGSTQMTLNNNGATFGNAATGAPVKVTGVANGSSDFDAVNVRQFGSAVAGAVASANIPGVDTNKTSSVGVGLGSYMNQQALAFGGSYRFSENGVLRASLATGLNTGGSKTSVGIGAGWSW